MLREDAHGEAIKFQDNNTMKFEVFALRWLWSSLADFNRCK
jgi:hypothetical protein